MICPNTMFLMNLCPIKWLIISHDEAMNTKLPLWNDPRLIFVSRLARASHDLCLVVIDMASSLSSTSKRSSNLALFASHMKSTWSNCSLTRSLLRSLTLQMSWKTCFGFSLKFFKDYLFIFKNDRYIFYNVLYHFKLNTERNFI